MKMSNTSPHSATMPMKEWENKINELRSKTKDILAPSYATDENLYRWVKGYNGDIDKIMPKLKEHAQNRRILAMDNHKTVTDSDSGDGEPIFGQYHPSDPNFHGAQFVEFVFKCYKMPEFDKNYRDKDNNLLMFFSPKDIDFVEIAKHYRTSDYMWFNMVMGEMAQILVREVEAELNVGNIEPCNKRTIGLTMVEDMAGVNWVKIFKDFGKIGGNDAMLLSQDNFPEQSARMILVRPPVFISWIWGWIKSLFNEVTQAKFHFYSASNWRSEIEKIVDVANIPDDFGADMPTGEVGSRRASRTDSRESSGGDKVSENAGGIEWPEILDISLKIPDVNKNQLQSISIKPNRETTFTFTLNSFETHSVLKWYFETNSPVKFSVSCKDTSTTDTDWQRIVPMFSLSTHLLPEWGEVDLMTKFNNPSLSRETKFRITFRNESTKLFALKLKLWIGLEVKDDPASVQHFMDPEGAAASWVTVE